MKQNNLKKFVESVASGMNNAVSNNTNKVIHLDRENAIKVLDIAKNSSTEQEALEGFSKLLGTRITADMERDRGFGPEGTFGDLYATMNKTHRKEIADKLATLERKPLFEDTAQGFDILIYPLGWSNPHFPHKTFNSMPIALEDVAVNTAKTLWNNGECDYSEIMVVNRKDDNIVFHKADRSVLAASGARDGDEEY